MAQQHIVKTQPFGPFLSCFWNFLTFISGQGVLLPEASAVLFIPAGLLGSTPVFISKGGERDLSLSLLVNGIGCSARGWSDAEAEKTSVRYLWMVAQYSLPQTNQAAEPQYMCLTEVSLSV